LEIFQNQINTTKFKSTNYIWNQLRLNSPWSVGYVSTLIESKDFVTKEEWRQFYYESGEERLRKINELCTPEEKEALLDFTKATPTLSKELKELNFSYGRTEEELDERGRYMYQKIVEQGNPNKVTLAECIYMVKFRVMGETWNGIIARERNTVKTMEEVFPNLSFKKTEGERDYQYGIDYELYEEEELLCAVQIKPMSYMKGFSKEIIKAKKANEAKNQKYKEEYKADVLYVYSNSKGIISNDDVLSEIKQRALLKSSF
jgi:MjaI restriction endonuclease